MFSTITERILAYSSEHPFILWCKDEGQVLNEIFILNNDNLLSWDDYQQYTVEVWKNFAIVFYSICQWLYTSFFPILLVLKWLVIRIFYNIYRVIQIMHPKILKNITTIYQKYVKDTIIKLIEYEKNLTYQQYMQQFTFITCIVILYYIHKWFQTTKFFYECKQFIEKKKLITKNYVQKKKRTVDNFIDHKKRYIHKQRQKVTRAYRQTVKRISEVSSLLAMIIPHALFMGISIVLKLLLPSVVTYLACETNATSLISWWYPFLWTILLLHQVRSEEKNKKDHTKEEGKDSEAIISKKKEDVGKEKKKSSVELAKTSSSASKRTNTVASRYKAAINNKKNVSSSSTTQTKNLPSSSFRGAGSGGGGAATAAGPQPRMTRATRLRMEEIKRNTEEQDKKNLTRFGNNHTGDHHDKKLSSSKQHRPSGLERVMDIKKYTEYSLDEQVNFWLHYWNLYASLQLFKVLMTKIPFAIKISSMIFSDPMLAQIELLFLIWVIFMDHNVLVAPTETFSKDSWQFLLTERPPIGVSYLLQSFYLPIYESTSNAISVETWNEKVVKKVTSLLDALVLIRFLSSNVRTWILNHLQQLHSFIIPSITLSMPGVITQYGVLYVQYVVPNAHAAQKKESQIIYLQYWVLHILTAAQLNYWSAVIWWIPFSSHLIYILWCTLSFTHISNIVYNEFESEMEAFGFLPSSSGTITATGDDATKKSSISFEQTRTSRLIKAFVKVLPSASKEDNDKNDNESNIDENDDDNNNNNSETDPGFIYENDDANCGSEGADVSEMNKNIGTDGADDADDDNYDVKHFEKDDDNYKDDHKMQDISGIQQEINDATTTDDSILNLESCAISLGKKEEAQQLGSEKKMEAVELVDENEMKQNETEMGDGSILGDT